MDTSGWSPEPEPLIDAPKMADLVGSTLCFIGPGRREVWAEAIPEKNQKERAFVPCDTVLVFPAGGGGRYERHDDYRVWQSTIYRHLTGPIRVYKIIRRKGKATGWNRCGKSPLTRLRKSSKTRVWNPTAAGGGLCGWRPRMAARISRMMKRRR